MRGALPVQSGFCKFWVQRALLFVGLLFVFPRAWGEVRQEDLSVFSDRRVVRSGHFVVHYEDPMAPVGILNTLEGVNAKILLDLGVFSPWAYKESIQVYLYRDASSYTSHTGAQSYTVAYIHIQEKKIFGYPCEQFQRVIAHELGHLYFTQYFLAASSSPPLWLNEGVATLMEWEYGLAVDQRAVNRQLIADGPIPFPEFFTYTYVKAGPEDRQMVLKWYSQAQSVTSFLFRGFSRAQFFKFCEALRSGHDLDGSLKMAYGPLCGSSSLLENLWKKSLTTE